MQEPSSHTTNSAPLAPWCPTVEVDGGWWRVGLGGFYADDLMAIRAGVQRDGHAYRGTSLTPGHAAIRNAGRALLIDLLDSDGHAGAGDAATVQYAGVVGREAVLDPARHGAEVDLAVERLRSAGTIGLRAAWALVDDIRVDGRQLHAAVRYGISQAILQLAAARGRTTMAHAVRTEFGLGAPAAVDVFGQCGENRRVGVDKLVMKRADALPHGLINAPGLFGHEGATLLDYVAWVRDRVIELGAPTYAPTLHFDVYGLLGVACQDDLTRMLRLCERIVAAAAPFAARIEAPIDGGSRAATIGQLARLRAALAAGDVPLEVVADDWCNTLEDVQAFVDAGAADVVQIKTPDLGGLASTIAAVQVCHTNGIKAYVGGTCNETDVSARACTHVAAAMHADVVLAKPGMGVDEGLMIVRNELERLLMHAHLARRQANRGERLS